MYGRYLDNTAWHKLDNAPDQLTFSDIDKDLQKMLWHFQETATAQKTAENLVTAIQTEFEAIVSGLTKASTITTEKAKQLQAWLKKNLKYLDDDNAKENTRYEKIEEQLERPLEFDSVLAACEKMMPKFILFSNYFRIKPVLHLTEMKRR